MGSPSRALGVRWDIQEGRQGESHRSFKRQVLSRKHYDLLLIVLWVAGTLTIRDVSKEGMRVSAGPSCHPPSSSGALAIPCQHQRPLWPSSPLSSSGALLAQCPKAMGLGRSSAWLE